MDRKEKAKYKWKEIYSYIVPSVITAGYFVCIILAEKGKIEVTLMQQSKYFEKMLESLITFMSIILIVFGFLIPTFLGGKGDTKAINYFLKYADMKIFAAKLKNIVAVGLIDIFITSVLLLTDIIPNMIMNIIIIIWLWLLFFFMCSSYRFISIMINLLLVEKEDYVQKAANEVSEETKMEVHKKLRKI